jgi:hypothetical protein
MQIIIDSVCVNHLLRQSHSSRKREKQSRIMTPLDKPIKNQQLIIILDNKGGLKDEWGRTCGEETINAIISYWADLNAIIMVEPVRSIGSPHSKILKNFGFNDTIDKLILRIALASYERNVVSDEPDFWNPAQRQLIGDVSACVAKYCREQLGVKVMLLSELIHCF